MRRKEFLQEFLVALGAVEVQWLEETEDRVSGTVIYEPNDPEEKQGFVWNKSEMDAPGRNVVNLAKLINPQNLLSIDQIKVTRAELQAKYNSAYDHKTTEQKFANILGSLEAIEVPMVDEVRETDTYIIHD